MFVHIFPNVNLFIGNPKCSLKFALFKRKENPDIVRISQLMMFRSLLLKAEVRI
jgi:hypothetical protein